MEAACWRTSGNLCFRSLRIFDAIMVLVLGLDFSSEDPYSMGDAINILLFPDLSPSTGSKADLLAQR